MPLLGGSSGRYLSRYLTVIFCPRFERARLDNTQDNTSKTYTVTALGNFCVIKTQPKTLVGPAPNCQFASGAYA